MGDAAGIGPEVARAALASGKLNARFEYRLIGSCLEAVPGQPDEATARAAIAALEESVELLKSGEIRVRVKDKVREVVGE